MASDQIDNVLRRVSREFSEIPRPKEFTNPDHCCECADHDCTLQNFTPETISFNELGNPGWDPVCFMTDEAFKYFFPAFCRLAANGDHETWYLDQFLFHLNYDGKRNSRWQSFDCYQRQLVREFLEALLETRAKEIEQNGDSDDLLTAIETWSEDE